jgi:hypothetical protein
VTLVLVCIVAAGGRAHSAPAHGAKTIEIRPDGTIVTSRNGKVVDVDRHTLSAPPPAAKAKPRTVQHPMPSAQGQSEVRGAASAPAVEEGSKTATSSVLRSLRTHPEPDVAAKRATMTARDLAWILPLILAILMFFTSYCLFLVAAFQESPWWGLAVTFIPIASLVFLIVHFDKARMAVLAAVLGAVLLALTVGALLCFAPGRGVPWSGAGETTGLRGSLRGQSPRSDPSRARSTKVTGPSFTSSTSMWAAKRPVATVMPSLRSRSAKYS